jgi:SOS-response transcriptional repressor LexA
LLPESGDVRDILGVQIETSATEQHYAERDKAVKENIPMRVNLGPALPVAEAVSRLRKSLGYTQQQLADALGVIQTRVAKWEKGKLQPPGPICAVLARLAPDEEKGYWLSLAGLSHVQQGQEHESGIRWVPLLREAAACGTPRAIDEREVEEMLSLPRRWMPQGGSIFAIKVTGDSMSPLLEEGYIALINVASHQADKLVDRMVLARDGDEVTLKWLRQQESMLLLVPQNTSPRHPVHVWTRSDNRAIVGEVVCWIGHPPQPRKRK